MSIEKDTFSQMVEKQLNEFEVPYNPSHWDEMSMKLDDMPTGQSGNSSLIKKISLFTAAVVVLVGAYYIFSPKETSTTSEEINPELQENSQIIDEIQESETTVSPDKPDSDNIISSSSATESVKQESPSQDISNSEKVESKLDKYANISEQNVKDEVKEVVQKMVDDQQSEFKGESPKIDNPELKTDIVIETTTACEGEAISFKASRNIDGAEYYWDFGDKGLKSRKVNPEHTFKKPGNYTVSLLVDKGEKNTYQKTIEVNIKQKPSVKINSLNNQITLEDPYAQFECICSENDELTWTFNETSRASGREVDFLIPERNTFNVQLTATNKEGCQTTDNYTYQAFKGVKIDVEKAITLNSDGKNESFIPKELTISDVDFTFVVMDPSGKIVFETRDKYNPWNGKMNNVGNDLPQGTYIWKLSFTDKRGKLHKQDGVVNLIR